MKYALHGKLKARKGKGKELAEVLLKAADLVANAKGCQVYLVSTENGEEDSVWVTEVWDTKEDHDNSLKLPEVRELITQAIPVLDGQPKKGQELAVIGGAGIKK